MSQHDDGVVEEIWSRCQRAVQPYEGKPWAHLSKVRRKLLVRVINEVGPEAPEMLIHGFAWLHGYGTWAKWRDYLRAETIFRPTHEGPYMDAYVEAIELGNVPPFKEKRIQRKHDAPSGLTPMEQWTQAGTLFPGDEDF